MFKGDLNISQRIALFWLINRETEDNLELEKIKMQSNAMASNPLTQNEYIKQIFKTSNTMQTDEELVEEDEIEWVTPQSQEELDELAKLLEGF